MAWCIRLKNTQKVEISEEIEFLRTFNNGLFRKSDDRFRKSCKASSWEQNIRPFTWTTRLYNTVHVQSILQPQISSLFRFECKQLKHQYDGIQEKKNHSGLVGWLYYCFTALRHILGHFERGHLAYPHCSWASLLGSLPVHSAHSFASNWQMPFLNQRKGDNERRNFFMTKFPLKNVPGVRIEPATVCLPGGTRIRTS